jgi:FixJ family two-component response regulator
VLFRSALDEVKAYGDPIHLLITDVMMPQISGPEVAEQLLTIYPKLKILMMSGYLDEGVERPKSLEDKSTFLQKPFTMNQFLQCVSSLTADIPNPS